MSMRGSIGGAGAVFCVALLALVATLASGCGGDSSSAGEAKVVSAAELQDFASSAGFPIYWLGERPGTEIELTEEESGRIYVRYLEPGVEPGEARAASLTVGTYPSEDGVAELRGAAHSDEKKVLARTDDGAVMLVDPNSSTSAHLAYPGAGPQVEVYSPRPGQALRLASRGAVRPVQ